MVSLIPAVLRLVWILVPSAWAATCPAERAIVVDLKSSRLLLCDGAEQASFPVALGRGGSGKAKQGDRRTPIGTYTLGSPRASERFHVFIPIGYPTAEQRAQGLTGRDVDIHGPTRIFRWAGRLNTLFGWTEGCVAVGSDEEIKRIAAWVTEKRPASVVLE